MGVDERLSPLIDIVLLLLIFFMLAGRIDATDPFVVTPPESVSKAESGDEQMTILIGPDGALAINGLVMSEEEILVRLRAMSKHKKTLIKVKADNGADASRLVDLMNRMREAGVERFRLLTVGAVER